MAAGQLQSIIYSDGTPAASYSYDRLGRLVTASGGGSGRAFAYQGNTNLVASETMTGGPTAGTSVSTGYDGLLRRSSLQVSQGQTSLVSQSFGFDAASRLASAAQYTAFAAYSYVNGSAANLVQSIVFTNSGQPVMTTSKSYDTLDRLTSISSTVANQTTPVSGFNYTYNAANERIQASVLSDGSHWTYGYDGLGQVTLGSRQWSDNSAVGGQQFGYSFDSIGNRTSATVNGRQSQYSSNALNQYSQRTVPGAVDVIGTANPAATVTINSQTAARQSGGYFYGTATVNNTQSAADAAVSVTAVQLAAGNTSNAVGGQQGSIFVPQTPEQFTYDADGNLTQDGHWTYTWDGENRLIGMQALSTLSAADRKKLTFSYDDTSRRVQKEVLTWNTGSSTYVPADSTLFGYDGWNLVVELNGANSGALLRSYLWGIDLSGTL
jgi:YD repeat-containing protein